MIVTRRNALKASGVALGALAIGGAHETLAQCLPNAPCYPVDPNKTQEYSYFNNLKASAPLALYTPLLDNEMRISFMGSTFPLARRAQMEMSVFVEVGPWVPGQGPGITPTFDPYGRATDSFIFDLGTGSSTNYSAMGIAFRKMDKLFINHLHADHMGDLSQVYCFGPGYDRLSPMYVWGPGPSGVKSPRPPRRLYDDGTRAFCKNLREAMRWCTESFSMFSTASAGYRDHMPTQELWGTPCDLIPVGDDPPYDGFALIPIELDWTKVGGIAYNNPDTGVKISHFPVIHTRRGSLGYKFDWNGLSMIYTSDTRAEWNSVTQACNGGKGVDVFIHDMLVPPEVYAMKLGGYSVPPNDPAFRQHVESMKTSINTSHTPQGAFGYLLSQIKPLPRLTVATHFPVADDTVNCAMSSVRAHLPDIGSLGEKIVWSFDTMVIRVFAGDPKPAILQQVVSPISDFTFAPFTSVPDDLLAPKYQDPFAQIDLTAEIMQNKNGKDNWCDSGY